MKQHYFSGAVVMSLVLSMLCLADKPASKYRIEKLITDLNNRQETNKTAQLELVEIGREAVPALLEQVKLYADPTKANCTKAARAFHVLSQIKIPDAIPLAREILINFTIQTVPKTVTGYHKSDRNVAQRLFREKNRSFVSSLDSQESRYGLKTEALEYIFSVFFEKKARDVYASLVIEHTRQYYGSMPWLKINVRSHKWYGGTEYWYSGDINLSSKLMLNMLKGIPLMIQAHDARAEDICIHLLQSLPYQPNARSSFIAFTSGWQPVVTKADTEAYSKAMLDSKGRLRMVVMKYLRELKSHRAIPDFETMLKSTNPDERNYALAMLEEITRGGSDSAIPATEVPEEDKYDKIVMRNGDIVSGRVMNASLHLKTSYGAPEFKTSTINFIKMEGANSKTDSIELRNGDKLTGSLSDETFTIKLKAGQTMAIKKKDIASIDFRRVWIEEKEENNEK